MGRVIFFFPNRNTVFNAYTSLYIFSLRFDRYYSIINFNLPPSLFVFIQLFFSKLYPGTFGTKSQFFLQFFFTAQIKKRYARISFLKRTPEYPKTCFKSKSKIKLKKYHIVYRIYIPCDFLRLLCFLCKICWF